jgi:uncharacterized protein (TIGR02757 family)
MKMNFSELKQFLDEKVELYNTPTFIESDPISIPHQFDLKEDIEIMGFLVSTIAWGNRKMIIKSGNSLASILGNSPYDFIMNYGETDSVLLRNFKHRTFNSFDLDFFITALKTIYTKHKGLENVFSSPINSDATTMQGSIENFRKIFFETVEDSKFRTFKHVASPAKGSASKRINMYLRWMVRQDKKGVDFGVWKSISPSLLSCPLDVHSGNVGRALGLLPRKQNDWKAVMELDGNLRKMDASDPVKYDFALFGLGVFEKFA